jgi:hypothetical protein
LQSLQGEIKDKKKEIETTEALGEALSLQSHDKSVVQKIRDIQAEARSLGEFCDKRLFILEQEMTVGLTGSLVGPQGTEMYS